MRSRSTSKPSDYIQSSTRFTRKMNLKLKEEIKGTNSQPVVMKKILDQKHSQRSRPKNKNNIVSKLASHFEHEFLRSKDYMYLTMDMKKIPNKVELMKLYQAVTAGGGFKKVTSHNEWHLYDNLVREGSNSAFELYKKYLFHYEKIFNEETKLSLDMTNDGVCVEDLDPDYFMTPTIYTIKSEEDITPELISKVLKQDVCVIRNFEKAVKFNKSLFNVKKLSREHPDAEIDIVTQNPDIKTFKRTAQEKTRILLSDYVKYQEQKEVKDSEGNIKFGVNLDLTFGKSFYDAYILTYI